MIHTHITYGWALFLALPTITGIFGFRAGSAFAQWRHAREKQSSAEFADAMRERKGA